MTSGTLSSSEPGERGDGGGGGGQIFVFVSCLVLLQMVYFVTIPCKFLAFVCTFLQQSSTNSNDNNIHIIVVS